MRGAVKTERIPPADDCIGISSAFDNLSHNIRNGLLVSLHSFIGVFARLTFIVPTPMAYNAGIGDSALKYGEICLSDPYSSTITAHYSVIIDCTQNELTFYPVGNPCTAHMNQLFDAFDLFRKQIDVRTCDNPIFYIRRWIGRYRSVIYVDEEGHRLQLGGLCNAR